MMAIGIDNSIWAPVTYWCSTELSLEAVPVLPKDGSSNVDLGVQVPQYADKVPLYLKSDKLD